MTTTIDELQRLVNSGVWRNNKILATSILDQFYQLNAPLNDFGTPEFWMLVFGENCFGGDGELEDFYNINETSRVKVKRFKTEASTHSISFKKLDELTVSKVCEILNNIIQKVYWSKLIMVNT